MTSTSDNNKSIAKNTLFLYIRMLFMMAVALYTSRVILNTLGVEDFGIYNVVGGVVAMFGFINSSMTSATQRYITFALGRNENEKLKKVFSTSVQIHFLIAVLILILGEVIGLWFLYNKMQIPNNRLDAAFWVLQCSILSSAIMIMSVPYNATIVAHEKMSAFAYISVLEAVLKLLIVYSLLFIPGDNLIVYALLVLIVQLLVRFVYARYCKLHFDETKHIISLDKNLFKEMLSFAFWSLWGNLGFVLYTQGLNILLNIFFGPMVNAARGIAVQVQGVANQFVSNFQMAVNPQITKSYAMNDLETMHNLMFRGSRFSFFLLFILVLPIILETRFILTLWLKMVPENTIIFIQIMLFISLLRTQANYCNIANQSTGKVKTFQMVEGGILMLIVPVSYISLRLGFPPYSVFIIHFIIEIIAQIFRLILLRKLIHISIVNYFKSVITYILRVSLISPIVPVILRLNLEYGWGRFIIVVLSSLVSVGISIYLLGIVSSERILFKKSIGKCLKFNKDL